MDLSNFDESCFQALYSYRSSIGWINKVIASDVETAMTDRSGEVQIGRKFFNQSIQNLEDLAFILAHEAAHKNVALLIASELELCYRYSNLINKGWSANFLEDFFINQSLFHAIPSNLPERFYADCKNWSVVFLQRSPKLFNTLKDLTEEQENALSQFKYAAQDWYKTNDLSNLYEVFKTGCDFLALMPPDKNNQESKSLVDHSPEDLDGGEGDPQGGEGNEASEGTKNGIKLRIPLIQDAKSASRFNLNDLMQALASLSSAIGNQAKRISEASGTQRIIGYSSPQDEELVNWELENYVPWTEAVVSPQKQEIVVLFDISGSMFKYLTLLHSIRAMLYEYKTQYFAFSSIVSNISFRRHYAEAKTGFGTSLGCILQILQKLEPSNVFIITDADWKLDTKEWPIEYAENLFRKHKITIFQQGHRNIRYIGRDYFTVVKL